MRFRIKDFTTKVGSGVTPRGGAEVYQNSGIPLFRSQNVTDDGFLLDDIAYISPKIDEEMSGSRIKPNDVLLNITGASIGRCYYVPADFNHGNVNQHVCIIRPIQKIVLSPYLHLLLISQQGKEYIKISQTGSGREGLTAQEIKRFSFNIPSLDIQHRIVSYLDAETAKIDHALELLHKKRDAYTRLKTSIINRAVTRGLNPNVPLKKSGVKWMGEIPEGWSVYRLKDLGYLYSGLTGKSGEDFRSEDLSSTKPYIPFTNVLNHLEIDPSQVSLVVMKENERQNTVRKNDLIFLMSSEDYESIAKSSLVTTEICETYLNSFCRGFRLTSHLVYAKYLNYELCSILYRDHLRLEARGFTRINIKVDRIESMSVAFPSVPEQHAIASYLDDHCGRIDHAISIVDKQIDAYKRLKKSLINEVVTGKRKV